MVVIIHGFRWIEFDLKRVLVGRPYGCWRVGKAGMIPMHIVRRLVLRQIGRLRRMAAYRRGGEERVRRKSRVVDDRVGGRLWPLEVRLGSVEGELVEEVGLGMLVEGRIGGHGDLKAAGGEEKGPEQPQAQCVRSREDVGGVRSTELWPPASGVAATTGGSPRRECDRQQYTSGWTGERDVKHGSRRVRKKKQFG
jgi:hypothetical protein